MTVESADRDVIRRTSRRIALQTAVVFAVALCALAAVAAFLVVGTQRVDGRRLLDQAIADSDAVTDPPSGIYIYEMGGTGTHVSAGLPDGAPLDPEGLVAGSRGEFRPAREVSRDGREFLVLTGHRDGTVVQAALDLTDQQRERERLMAAMVVAGAAGLLLAAGVGWFIARRAIRPLALAFDRQQRFIADASHELRTPLTQVHTRAQLLQRGLARQPVDSTLVADVDQLVRGTRQFGEILDEMLLAAQLRDQPQRWEPVDLAEVARDVVAAEQPRAAESGITLEASVGELSYVVRGSGPALRRVVNALVDNAFGHTPTGGRITVTVDADDGAVRCVVADDGSGFDRSRITQMFERFGRGEHGTGRRYGLGLALVKEVVTAHHGTVTAESPAAGGAVFTVVLPAPADG